MSKETSKKTLTTYQKIKGKKRKLNLPKNFDTLLGNLPLFGEELNNLESVGKTERYLTFHGSLSDRIREIPGVVTGDIPVVLEILQMLRLTVLEKFNRPTIWQIRSVEYFREISQDKILLEKIKKEYLESIKKRLIMQEVDAKVTSLEMALKDAKKVATQMPTEPTVEAPVAENGRFVPDMLFNDITSSLRGVTSLKHELIDSRLRNKELELQLEKGSSKETSEERLLEQLEALQGDDTSPEE